MPPSCSPSIYSNVSQPSHLAETATHLRCDCVDHSGLCPVWQGDNRVSGRPCVNVNDGNCAIRIVDGLHHGALIVGGSMRLGLTAALIIEYMKQILSPMVLVTVLNNSSQSLCPGHLHQLLNICLAFSYFNPLTARKIVLCTVMHPSVDQRELQPQI